MLCNRCLALSLLASLTAAFLPCGAAAQESPPVAGASMAAELAGLWGTTKRFGPDARGPLILQRAGRQWTADFMGRTIAVREQDGVLTFSLPDGQGSFRARIQADGGLRNGQWFQPPSPVTPPFGTDISFTGIGAGRWQGEVQPVDAAFTLYLQAEARPDGTVAAFIRNPDRNIGLNLGVERLERDGTAVRLIGRRPGRTTLEPVMSGTYEQDSRVLRLYLPERGGSYDFRRESDASHFYPRGRNPGTYRYRPPLARDDGWAVGTLGDASIDQAGIEQFVQMLLDMPMDSVNAPEVHGILIARGGKLVLEEYFHGYHRDRLHDTRSASKSLTATLVGAAMQARLPVALSDPVYRVMNGGRFPDGLAPPKRSMQLRHLLNMTSGIHCDDGDPQSPGQEDRMLDQTEEPDYYRYYMAMPMDRQPGERAIYCSGDPNLAIGVLHRATGQHPMDLFDRLLGKPLQIERHGWYLSPALQPYGGGSVQILPRDFMKMGQVMLDGGTWKGKRILPRGFVDQAASGVCPLNKVTYGNLWWSTDFPYRNGKVKIHWAGGNGGQGVIVIPDLDLVIGTFGGSYASRVGLVIQQVYAARFILPAVGRPGEPAPAYVPAEYELIYGRERPAPPCPDLLAPVATPRPRP